MKNKPDVGLQINFHLAKFQINVKLFPQHQNMKLLLSKQVKSHY